MRLGAAIKSALGKLRVPDNLPEHIDAFDFERLRCHRRARLGGESTAADRQRPFDRLLVAQAVCEGATVRVADTVFDSYAVKRIW